MNTIKTSVSEVPVCNEELYKEVAVICDTSPKQVEECLHIVSEFVKKTMEAGAFESVMLPYLGKIQVKPKLVQWKNHAQVMPVLPTHLQPKEDDGTL